MKKIIKNTVLIVFLLLVTGSTILYFFPEKVVAIINYNTANKVQLENKVIDINSYKIHYYENSSSESKEVLVFLHGMGNDKTSFLQTVSHIEGDYHFMLLDLPGHGENSRKLDLDYSINGQILFLNSFFTKLKLEKVTLIGNSMGGHISAAYAIKHPNKVKRVVLVNSAGVKLNDDEVYFGFEKPMESIDEFDSMLSRVFHNKPNFPYPIKKFMMKEVNKNMNFVNLILVPSIKTGKFFNLKNDVSKIKAKTLVLWGKEDRIININVAEYLRDNIKNSELKFIEDTGHFPQLESPFAIAKEISEFIIVD